jgi:pimeloyl-ACP methyl ester carboxylesterase
MCGSSVRALVATLLLASCLCGVAVHAQGVPSATPNGVLKNERFHAEYVWLGSVNFTGVLYVPERPAANYGVAVVYAYTRGWNYDTSAAAELASRGYRVLLTTHLGPYPSETPFDGIFETARGVAWLRTLSDVQRVVVMGHSGGGRMMASYAHIALNGPAACQEPQVFIPCRTEELANLPRPDGVIMLDPGFGSLETTSAVDPAWDGKKRTAALDMYSPANGYDPVTGSATYSPEFRKRFYAAQSARNMQLVNAAVARLKLIEQGKGQYSDDEPLVIPAMVDSGNGARLSQTDVSIQSHTKKPHLLLKADGTTAEEIIRSVRAPSGLRDIRSLGTLNPGTINNTVRTFLGINAMRTTPDFAFTEDDIVGVDWKSSIRSTPNSAAGITVPTLIMTMTCFYLIVPGEIAYDHLAAKDKTYVAVEGATHGFSPCKPEYGDTKKRTFDYLASWLAKPGRF